MQTDITLAYLQKTRQLFLAMIRDLTLEQLNEIPVGFNNNIIWNLGHLTVSTLGLCYIRSQVKPDMALPFPGRFGKGTRPEVVATAQEVADIKHLYSNGLDQIAADIKAGVFERVVPSSTETYQVPMDSIANILNCCLAHENLHLGIAKAQKAVILSRQQQEVSAAKEGHEDRKLSLN